MRPDLLAGLFFSVSWKKIGARYIFPPDRHLALQACVCKVFFMPLKKTISIPYAMDRQVMCAIIKHNAGHQ